MYLLAGRESGPDSNVRSVDGARTLLHDEFREQNIHDLAILQ